MIWMQREDQYKLVLAGYFQIDQMHPNHEGRLLYQCTLDTQSGKYPCEYKGSTSAANVNHEAVALAHIMRHVQTEHPLENIVAEIAALDVIRKEIECAQRPPEVFVQTIFYSHAGRLGQWHAVLLIDDVQRFDVYAVDENTALRSLAVLVGEHFVRAEGGATR